MAVFPVPSLVEAARLAEAVAGVPGLVGAGVLMTIADDLLTVRQTRDMRRLVWMQELDPAKSLRHAMHVDVSVAREQAEERLAAALAAGGRIVDDSDAPAGSILADRAGNRVCIASWPDGASGPADAGPASSVEALSDPVEPFGDERPE